MEPTNRDSANELATDSPPNQFGDGAPRRDEEPMISSEPVALGNTSHVGPWVRSGSVERENRARSALIWVLPLVILTCLAVMFFIHLHTHPVDDGKVRGPGDEAAPNAPRDYKYR